MILTKDELYHRGFDFVIEALNRGESVNLVPTAKVDPEFERELSDLIKTEVTHAKPYSFEKVS